MTDTPELPEPVDTDAVAAATPEGDDYGPQIPAEPAPPITSRFLFVDVAALRAKQLRRGARIRFAAEQAPHKLERVAMEEVRRGLVYYDVPPPRAAEAQEGQA
jgi:DNA-directed RNA polymerase subunit K/omega